MNNELENSKFAHVLLYPVSWSFAKIVKLRKKYAKKPIGRYSYFFDGYPSVGAMRTGAKGHVGVNSIYNYEHIKGKSKILESFWMSARNCQALRNRFRLVKAHLDQTITEHSNSSNEKMLILSLASGTTKGLLEVAGGRNSVSIIAVDSNPDAIESSQKLAQELKASNITWHKKDLLAVDSFTDTKDKVHLVEIIGLFEYLTDEQALAFLEKVKKHMKDGAILITSQIHPNSESHIVKEIVDWDMNHRTRDHFTKLLQQAGFEIIQTETEPHKIHTVFKAKKK